MFNVLNQNYFIKLDKFVQTVFYHIKKASSCVKLYMYNIIEKVTYRFNGPRGAI